MKSEQRVAPLLPPAPDNNAGIDLDSHVRHVQPPQQKKRGPFVREHPFTLAPEEILAPEIQALVDANKEKNATDQANRLFHRYLRIQAEYERRVNLKEPASLLEVDQALSDLWSQLHHNPVALARKAQLIAAIEPARKRLLSEEYRSELLRAKQQESFVRHAYLAAKTLQHQHHGLVETGRGATFYPIDARQTQENLDQISAYIRGPALIRPTQAEQDMDQMIRKDADHLVGEEDALEAHRLLFLHTDKILSLVQQVAREHAAHPSHTTKQRIEQLQARLNRFLQEEQRSYETPRMHGERFGLERALREFKKDKFLKKAYQEALEAEIDPARDEAHQRLEITLRSLRPGERTLLERVLRLRNEITLPREHLILRQHLAAQELQTTTDERRRLDLETQIKACADRLHEPQYCDKPLAADTVERVFSSAEVLKNRWKIIVANPPSPKTAADLQPLWDSLQAQYTHGLRLLELAGRIEHTDLGAAHAIGALEEALENIRLVEAHYTVTLLANTNAETARVDTDITILETAHGEGRAREERITRIQTALATILERLKAFKDQFPPLIRHESYSELNLRFSQLCFRFESTSGTASANTTVRPPRPSNPEVQETLQDLRGRE